MAVNKIELASGEVLIDLTNDSVTSETLAEGVTAHGADGEPIVGTMRNVEASGGGLTIDGILTANEPIGAIVSEITSIRNTSQIANLFAYNPNITSIRMPNVTNVTNCPLFRDCKALKDVYIPSVITSTAQAFNGTAFSGTMDVRKMFPNLTTLGGTAFNNLDNVTRIILPATIKSVGSKAFNNPMRGLTDIVFTGTPQSIAADMVYSSVAPYVKDVWVPWAEGEVANAPWGATNATIHYNYTYTDEGGGD